MRWRHKERRSSRSATSGAPPPARGGVGGKRKKEWPVRHLRAPPRRFGGRHPSYRRPAQLNGAPPHLTEVKRLTLLRDAGAATWAYRAAPQLWEECAAERKRAVR